MTKKKIYEENKLLEEIASETPEKLIFTEAGTIMQDYIIAYLNQISLADSKGGGTYLSSLIYAVVDRINKNIGSVN